MIYKNKVSYGVCTNYYTVMFLPPQHTQCPEALPTNPLALFHQPPLFSQACNLQETRINVEYSSARAGDQFGEGMVTCAGLLLTSQHLWNSIVSKLEACCNPPPPPHANTVGPLGKKHGQNKLRKCLLRGCSYSKCPSSEVQTMMLAIMLTSEQMPMKVV